MPLRGLSPLVRRTDDRMARRAGGGLSRYPGGGTALGGDGGAVRYFCAACGTGLYYRIEQMLPGIVNVQSATLDEPDTYSHTVQIQCAERLDWLARLEDLPAFEHGPLG